MPAIALKIQTPIAAFPTSFVEGGGGRSALSQSRILKLPGSASDASVITIRATSSTAAELPGTLVLADALTNPDSVPLTITHKKLSGGTTFLPLAKLRALSIVLTADDLSKAEIEAGSAASRVANLEIALYSNGDAVTHFSGLLLLTSTAGQVERFDRLFPYHLGADAKIGITINSLALACKVEVFTAVES